MAARVPLLDALDEADRREFLIAARRRRFEPREVVFHEGDPGDSLHVVTRGHLVVRITTPLGEVASVRVLGPGEFFGELALIDPGPRNSTVIALDRAETTSITKTLLDDLRTRRPAFDAVVTQALVREVRRLAAALAEALYLPADKRVLRRLLDLSVQLSEDEPTDVVPVTQDELAQLAGVTRETANRILRRHAEDNLISLGRGRITILNRPELQRHAH